MKPIVVAVSFALALALVASCSSSNGNPSCFCDYDTEKYNGDACVAIADYVEPTCEAEGEAVCGCDDLNYTSSCAAYTAGVEVQYGGACRANGGGGGGFDFGW